MGIKAQQPLQQKSTQSEKPFVVKEGTTLDVIKKYGTKEQIAMFIFFDENMDNKIKGNEVTDFNSYSFKTNGDKITFTDKQYGYENNIEIAKLNQVDKNIKLLKKYGIKVSDNLTVFRINNVQEKTINGKKVLVINHEEYDLTVPLSNVKNLNLNIYDGMPAFENLKDATITIKDRTSSGTSYFNHPFFFKNTQAEINCRDGVEDRLYDEGNCKLTIHTNDKNDKLDKITLNKGTTKIDDTTLYGKARKSVIDWWNNW